MGKCRYVKRKKWGEVRNAFRQKLREAEMGTGKWGGVEIGKGRQR